MIQLLLQNAFFLEYIVLHTSAKYWKQRISINASNIVNIENIISNLVFVKR
jgi:hypothetical protein